MGPSSGETRTESCEVIAKEDVAAIAFSGKLTLNGRFPRPGRVKRIAEDLGKCGAVPIVGVSLSGAGLLGAISSIAPLCSELTSGLANGLDSVVGDESESAECTCAKFSEPRVFSLDFSFEGVASPGRCVPAESLELATGGVGVREVDPSG